MAVAQKISGFLKVEGMPICEIERLPVKKREQLMREAGIRPQQEMPFAASRDRREVDVPSGHISHAFRKWKP